MTPSPLHCGHVSHITPSPTFPTPHFPGGLLHCGHTSPIFGLLGVGIFIVENDMDFAIIADDMACSSEVADFCFVEHPENKIRKKISIVCFIFSPTV